MLEIGTLGWAVMIGLVVVLLAVDLVLATLRPHTVGFREAAAWSLFYVAVALGFGAVFQAQVGGEYGAEYFADTMRSCMPLKYSAPINVSGFAGSFAAMLSSFPASSAAASCFARAADFAS